MVTLEVPIEEVESWDPSAAGKVQPGIYEAMIEDVEVKNAQSGYPKLSVRYRILEGEASGGAVYGERSLHPNSLPYFRGFLDLLNVFATGKAIDEQKLVGRYLRVQVVEYDKQDGSKGVKVEKVFKSEANGHRNEQLDITAQQGGVKPGKQQTSSSRAAAARAAIIDKDKFDDLPF
jgi:hypothetical protein